VRPRTRARRARKTASARGSSALRGVVARRGGAGGARGGRAPDKTAPPMGAVGRQGDGLLTERHTKSVAAPEPRRRVRNKFLRQTLPHSASGKFPSPAPAPSPRPLVGTSTRARTSRLASGFSPSPPLGALARPPRHPRVASRSARTMRPPMGGRGGGGRGFGGGRSPGGRGGFGGRGGRGGRGGFDDGPPDTVVGASPTRFRLEARFSRARASRTRESRCLLLFFYPSSRAPAPRARFRARSSRRARR
jgi:hypothetical protein